MRLILHVGMHKTGTSALQALLRARTEELGRQGILYPTFGQHHDGAHHHLWRDLVDEEASRGFAASIMAEALASPRPIETVLLSSELLEKIGMDSRRSRYVPSFLAHFDSVLVVYFMRNQSEVIQSIFKQWVKDDAVRLGDGPASFLTTHGQQLFYSKYAEWWASVDDHIELRAGLYDGDWSNLWACFQKITGVDLDGSIDKQIYNPSMDGERLKLKHYLNRHVPRDSIDFSLNKWLTSNFSNKPTTSLFRSHEDHAEFQSFYKDENTKLSRIWGVKSLDVSRLSGDPFQTASPRLLTRFLDKLRADKATSESVLLNFDFKIHDYDA